jgi:hypothetical protein
MGGLSQQTIALSPNPLNASFPWRTRQSRGPLRGPTLPETKDAATIATDKTMRPINHATDHSSTVNRSMVNGSTVNGSTVNSGLR